MDRRIRPLSTIFASAWRCAWFNFARPRGLAIRKSVGPRVLKRRTQSRTICRATLPIRAVPEPPS
ncbi:hypothetical protein SS05631_c28530 [Sinorhizobium sp. CCBAU 05631]|nr:hypothetical protein SS05631_c28530 [Sinorhizobium sp. CCBAU 05631]